MAGLLSDLYGGFKARALVGRSRTPRKPLMMKPEIAFQFLNHKVVSDC
jgi:hypothetical protein